MHLELKNFWDKNLEKNASSNYYTGTREILFKEFKDRMENHDIEFAKKVILDLIDGKFVLLKSAFTKKFVENLKENVKKFWKQNPNMFYKMTEGCKDYHRIIDKEQSLKYSVTAIKHAAFFFPWNNDPCKINETIFNRWGYIKQLSGQDFYQYRDNTPKDGKVDRIQIAVYPPGFGEIKLHSDPIHNQPISLCGYLSSINNGDFETGGVYCLDKKNNEIELENFIDVGDIGFFKGSIKHGVKAINKKDNNKIDNYDWDSGIGRWFMGLYTNDSDEVKHRLTSTNLAGKF